VIARVAVWISQTRLEFGRYRIVPVVHPGEAWIRARVFAADPWARFDERIEVVVLLRFDGVRRRRVDDERSRTSPECCVARPTTERGLAEYLYDDQADDDEDNPYKQGHSADGSSVQPSGQPVPPKRGQWLRPHKAVVASPVVAARGGLR
jgi:hypothetical protein